MALPERILVVVDPTADKQPAIERAAWIARATRSRVELFICGYERQPFDGYNLDPAALDKARTSQLEHQMRRGTSVRPGEGAVFERDRHARRRRREDRRERVARMGQRFAAAHRLARGYAAVERAAVGVDQRQVQPPRQRTGAYGGRCSRVRQAGREAAVDAGQGHGADCRRPRPCP